MTQNMDKHLQVMQLCLPHLLPKNVCMLKCTCRELNAMRGSWEAHQNISLTLNGSLSAMAWLHKNIVAIKQLSLTLTFDPPKQLLRDVFRDGRALTHLWVEGQSIRALPTLPPQLQHLDVSGCKIRLLPALPATLQTLCCVNCAELTALPSSLSSTAVTELDCNGCVSLRRLPQLPESLGVLRAERCKALTELPELPAALTQLSCEGCRSLRRLPKLAHTAIKWLDIDYCSQLTEIPDLPVNHLQTLFANDLPQVTRLPALRNDGHYHSIHISNSGIMELPDSLPSISDFSCSHTPVERLPSMAGCRTLHLEHCQQLQQLPEQLPANLWSLDLSGCTLLQQLPAQLPGSLDNLNCEDCSSLQELPDLSGSSLKVLWIKGCAQLRGLHVRGCEDLVVHLQ